MAAGFAAGPAGASEGAPRESCWCCSSATATAIVIASPLPIVVRAAGVSGDGAGGDGDGCGCDSRSGNGGRSDGGRSAGSVACGLSCPHSTGQRHRRRRRLFHCDDGTFSDLVGV